MTPTDPSTHDDDDFARQVRRAVRELPDAPVAWREAAVALWPMAPSPLRAAAGALLAVVQAALRFDSWATPGLAHGMRGGRGGTRHLIYSAQGHDIDLRIAPAAEHFTLSGQVLGPELSAPPELAPLEADAGSARPLALDEFGEFRLEGVAAGRYTLTLHLPAGPVVVQPLEVGEPGA